MVSHLPPDGPGRRTRFAAGRLEYLIRLAITHRQGSRARPLSSTPYRFPPMVLVRSGHNGTRYDRLAELVATMGGQSGYISGPNTRID
jgi:hypothetical protein